MTDPRAELDAVMELSPELPFDPTVTPGAHEWFAAAIRDQETPDRPLGWPDRPDVYWCAGLAGGCDSWHRTDLAYLDVTVDDLPMRVCKASTPVGDRPGYTEMRETP